MSASVFIYAKIDIAFAKPKEIVASWTAKLTLKVERTQPFELMAAEEPIHS